MTTAALFGKALDSAAVALGTGIANAAFDKVSRFGEPTRILSQKVTAIEERLSALESMPQRTRRDKKG